MYHYKCYWFCMKIQSVKGGACPSSVINMNHTCFFLRAEGKENRFVSKNPGLMTHSSIVKVTYTNSNIHVTVTMHMYLHNRKPNKNIKPVKLN